MQVGTGMETIFTGDFSDPDATATPWEETEQALVEAELYWLTTVRADGRPHVTPLVGVWLDTRFWFTSGPEEQKSRNLEHHDAVAVTTGANRWAEGLDVVVEGHATRCRDEARLDRVAAAFGTAYDGAWPFVRVGDGLGYDGENPVPTWEVAPVKVLAFAKDPHAQTSYRF